MLGWTAKSHFEREMHNAFGRPLLPASRLGTFDDLISFGDDEFIREAYLILLGRECHLQHKSHSAAQLSRHDNRICVLANLHHSKESQATHRPLEVTLCLMCIRWTAAQAQVDAERLAEHHRPAADQADALIRNAVAEPAGRPQHIGMALGLALNPLGWRALTR